MFFFFKLQFQFLSCSFFKYYVMILFLMKWYVFILNIVCDFMYLKKKKNGIRVLGYHSLHLG